MAFWADTVTASVPVVYEPPPEYLLTLRFAALEPGSGGGALFLTTENVDGKRARALLCTLRPHQSSENVRLDLTVGFGTEIEFSVEPVGGKPGLPAALPPRVSLVGFIHAAPPPAVPAEEEADGEEESGEDGEEESGEDGEEESGEDGEEEEEEEEASLAKPPPKAPAVKHKDGKSLAGPSLQQQLSSAAPAPALPQPPPPAKRARVEDVPASAAASAAGPSKNPTPGKHTETDKVKAVIAPSAAVAPIPAPAKSTPNAKAGVSISKPSVVPAPFAAAVVVKALTDMSAVAPIASKPRAVPVDAADMSDDEEDSRILLPSDSVGGALAAAVSAPRAAVVPAAALQRVEADRVSSSFTASGAAAAAALPAPGQASGKKRKHRHRDGGERQSHGGS